MTVTQKNNRKFKRPNNYTFISHTGLTDHTREKIKFEKSIHKESI